MKRYGGDTSTFNTCVLLGIIHFQNVIPLLSKYRVKNITDFTRLGLEICKKVRLSYNLLAEYQSEIG
jgi:hypothetical protein